MPVRRDKSAKAEELMASFARGEFSRLYLFHGGEDFLVEEVVDALITHAVEESGRSFNLDIMYGSEVDVKDLVSHASAFPMMAPRRVVIVYDADKLTGSEKNREVLTRYLKDPSPTTVLVLTVAKPDFRLGVYKQFQESGVVEEFKKLYDEEAVPWIVARAIKLGCTIKIGAAQRLQGYIGNSLRDINNELQKLLIFIGDRTSIEEEDVDAVVGNSKSYNIFELQKAVGQRNISRSIEILERMLESGESSTNLVAGLTRYFNKLWILPSLRRGTGGEYQIATALGVNSFFLKEYFTASGNFPSTHIEQAFRALLEADTTLKSTGTDPKLVMTVLVHRLINPYEGGVFA